MSWANRFRYITSFLYDKKIKYFEFISSGINPGIYLGNKFSRICSRGNRIYPWKLHKFINGVTGRFLQYPVFHKSTFIYKLQAEGLISKSRQSIFLCWIFFFHFSMAKRSYSHSERIHLPPGSRGRTKIWEAKSLQRGRIYEYVTNWTQWLIVFGGST